MLDVNYLGLLIQRIAGTAISPSAAQKQGPPGTMASAIRFLYRPELLAGFCRQDTPEAFFLNLDIATEALRESLPVQTREDGTPRGKHWGSARKFLNIFLLECSLNRYVCDHYGAGKIEPWLEVPLDSYVGNGLAKEPENRRSPDPFFWNTIIGLDKTTSDRFQVVAQAVANRMGMHRAHLDLHYLSYSDGPVEV